MSEKKIIEKKVFLLFLFVCIFNFLNFHEFKSQAQISQAGYFFEGYKIEINIPSRELRLLFNNSLIRNYPVGVGRSKEFTTPVGDYEVSKKVLNPIWEHPYKKSGESRIGNSENNPLGNYWIGFHKKNSGEYGIHGTNDESSVGKFVSHGCVRMKNLDIQELFNLIPVGTPVSVVYERFVLEQDENKILMTVFPDPYSLGTINKRELAEELEEITLSSSYSYSQVNSEILNQALSDNGYSGKTYEIAELISENYNYINKNINTNNINYNYINNYRNYYNKNRAVNMATPYIYK